MQRRKLHFSAISRGHLMPYQVRCILAIPFTMVFVLWLNHFFEWWSTHSSGLTIIMKFMIYKHKNIYKLQWWWCVCVCASRTHHSIGSYSDFKYHIQPGCRLIAQPHLIFTACEQRTRLWTAFNIVFPTIVLCTYICTNTWMRTRNALLRTICSCRLTLPWQSHFLF